MDEIERLGRPYFQCRSCPYGSFDASYTAAHIRDHPPVPDPEPVEVVPAPKVPKRRRSK